MFDPSRFRINSVVLKWRLARQIPALPEQEEHAMAEQITRLTQMTAAAG